MYYSALIGKPTDHSVSHVMFEELAKAAGIVERYAHLKCNIEANRLGEALNACTLLGFKGLNVTLPYKMRIMDYLDDVDEVAKTLGAVNTITLSDRRIGYNTDWLGIVASINEQWPGVALEQVTIFGSGGAARAAIYACQHVGVRHTTVLYRNEPSQKTRALLQQRQGTGGLVFADYSGVAAALERSQLIINATSAGMIGEPPLPFALDLITHVPLRDKLYFDVVFNPLETPLAVYCKGKGARTLNGLWMMLYQGVAALSLWLGQELRIDQATLMKTYGILEKELQKEERHKHVSPGNKFR